MNSDSRPHAVFGATGRTGAAAADALLRAGQPVRVVVRDASRARAWTDRGAQAVVADLADPASTTDALRGVRGAYVVSPQQYDRADLFARADRIAGNLARAATTARVPRLVALSSVGADREHGTGWITMNRMLERRLGATGIPTVFVRAAYFMENWAPMVRSAMETGTLPTFLAPPDRRLPMVATADVGWVAAELLMAEGGATGAVALGGPQDYAPADVAAVLARLSGRPIGVEAVPEAAWPQALAAAGFSAEALAGFTEMTRGLNAGHIDARSDPGAVARSGAVALDRVIAGLAAWPKG